MELTRYIRAHDRPFYLNPPPSRHTISAAPRRPGQWQSLDIVFTAPRFHQDGTLKSPAYLTAFHNGVLIHNHFALLGTTSYYSAPVYEAHRDKEPLTIQFHRDAVRFRNIWIRENVQPLVGRRADQPAD
jgi:hypothetical protein